MRNVDSKIEERLGRCFELAGKFVLSHPEWNLVHAIITDKVYGTESSIVHAWCEKEDAALDVILRKDDRLVFDPVLNQEFLARAYYALYGIIDYRLNDYERRHKIPETIFVRYTGEQALRHIEDALNYGPWDEKITGHQDTVGSKTE
ncbi:MAG: hypothetical protein AB9921_02445 [Erysipelotrichaceae bacterium]